MNKNISQVLYGMFLTSITILCIGMTGGVEPEKKGPEFVKLKNKAINYSATIYEDSQTTDITELSFSGDTTLDEIKNEEHNFFITLDFAEIKELRIEKPIFSSNKYKTEDFIKASIITIKDTIIKNILIPRNTIICGKAELGLAWYLRDIKKIIIKHDIKKTIREIVKKQEKGWWQSIKDFLKL
jgi:hypothetical protein